MGKQDSTLAGFGGMKGVKAAREILIEYIKRAETL